MFEFTTIRAIADKLHDAETGNSATVAASNAVLGAAQEQARKQRQAFARMRTEKGSML